MDWLRRKSRRHIVISVPLLSAALGLLYLCRISEGHEYTPAGILPSALGGLNLSILPTDSAGQPGLLSGPTPTCPSIFDYPFPSAPLRPLLASRSGRATGSFDPRAFRDMLASYEIDLGSDPNETVNVELASEAIDGVVVRPIEIFTINSVVGRRSEDRGFRPGLMFSRGQVVTGIGGGVCLVSTALYNAAVRAGFKIIERSPHSGPVRYADPGLDAAVVYGLMDMRFKNDTRSPVMIRSQIQDGRLIVSLWGRRRPGFEVELAQEGYKEIPYKVIETEDPAVPEGEVWVKVPARTGFEVTIVRILKQDGKVIRREVLSRDRIPARNKVVLIPPKPKEEQPTIEQPRNTQQQKELEQARQEEIGNPEPTAPRVSSTPKPMSVPRPKSPGALTITLPPGEAEAKGSDQPPATGDER